MALSDTEKARNRLVSAACRYASAQFGGADSEDAMSEMGRAKDRLDLAARLYIEDIGPRVVDEPERDPHTPGDGPHDEEG